LAPPKQSAPSPTVEKTTEAEDGTRVAESAWRKVLRARSARVFSLFAVSQEEYLLHPIEPLAHVLPSCCHLSVCCTTSPNGIGRLTAPSPTSTATLRLRPPPRARFLRRRPSPRPLPICSRSRHPRRCGALSIPQAGPQSSFLSRLPPSLSFPLPDTRCYRPIYESCPSRPRDCLYLASGRCCISSRCSCYLKP
jgi:hypothetical protein